MAKKNYYYVIVLTDEGAKFVTGIMPHHYAEYDALKTPKSFPKEMESDIAWGLMANFNQAYMVQTPYEITTQPYMYDKGNFKWEWKIDIARLCYELYKVDFMKRISAERQMDALKNAYESGQYLMDYLEESGYDGECFVCFDEFMNAEFKDEEYIKGLLDNDKLFEEYTNFRKEREVAKK